MHEKTEGCVFCGKTLVYSQSPKAETCLVCGKTIDALASCTEGHYICDTCHSADILTRVERHLAEASEADPVALAARVFDLPGLNMHGPEYHSIVPAVLVKAYQNKTGAKGTKAVAEAIRRGKDIKGGSCGYCGGCGAAVGSGIAAAVIEHGSPMSNEERGKALRLSGQALLAISRHGGPRCCKREAITSIESFVKNSGCFDGTAPAPYVCRQFKKNKDCIGIRCPYFPRVKAIKKK
jgi:hypothetical protein